MSETNEVSSGAVSGSLSGALDPDSERASEHADMYYKSVRRMTTDIKHIAKNTGFDKSDIERVKKHLFENIHDLGDGRVQRFDPDYEISETWRRLVQGKDIQPHDIILLEHELLEIDYMEKGLSQSDAHELTNQKYNYQKALQGRKL
jgi:hypothetical protein